MRILTTILLLISLNGSLFSQNWLQKRITSEQFNKAIEHYDDGRFATTDIILQKLLTKQTDDYFFRFNYSQ